jgi:hypothetical protein
MARGWKFAAASVIGTSHLKSANPICQDSHACCYCEESDRLICVVSDGAGSATLSDQGSSFACEHVVTLVTNAAEEEVHLKSFALQTLESLRQALVVKATAEQVVVREFACTLLVAILSSGIATFWQIGDGAMCFRLYGEEVFKYAFWPDKGEYANTTFFVTDADFANELEYDSSPLNVVDIAMFSDGLERLALDFKLGEAHTAFFRGFFPALYRESTGRLTELQDKLADFLGSERVNKQTDDDKTLILATLEAS